jgi:hypothetical protein
MKNRRTVWLSILLLIPFGLPACAHRAAVPKPRAAQPARQERLVIAYDGEGGKTALELLKARARVRTSSGPLGELVEEINDIASGQGHYLIFFVNGAMAKTGAGNYVTKTGDRIEWKLIGPKKQ